jgi:hypothetical protein
MSYYHSESEIENVVRAFEACEIDKTEFKHAQHLTVAVWYVQTLGKNAALDRMRAGLLSFLNHHGVDKQKYNETVTMFWIQQIAEKLNELGTGLSLVEKCNRVVETYVAQPASSQTSISS